MRKRYDELPQDHQPEIPGEGKLEDCTDVLTRKQKSSSVWKSKRGKYYVEHSVMLDEMDKRGEYVTEYEEPILAANHKDALRIARDFVTNGGTETDELFHD